MKIGAMNHPRHDVVKEIRWMAELGLDFIDLTLEPPAAGYWQIDTEAVLGALRRHRFDVVGHTAYYLPLGHPFEEVRKAAVAVFARSLEVFAHLGAKCMNIHPDFRAPMHDVRFSVQQNLKSISELLPHARRLGMALMLENLPGHANDPAQLAVFLDPLPELRLHLDIGHTNLMTRQNTMGDILHRFGDRLIHVHLHDNRGGDDDLHLPLGAGTLELEECVKVLKTIGYDGTITLEVFTPDREFVRYSADKLRRMWGENRDP